MGGGGGGGCVRACVSACVHTARIGNCLSRSMLMYFVLCRARVHWWSILIASQVVWIRQLSGTSLDRSHSDLVRYRCYKRKFVGVPPVHFADLRASFACGDCPIKNFIIITREPGSSGPYAMLFCLEDLDKKSIGML